jgi:hypothetical protein
LDLHNTRAEHFFPSLLDDQCAAAEEYEGSDDEAPETLTDPHTSGAQVDIVPEKDNLILPSTIIQKDIPGLRSARIKEVRLRCGQANDILENMRKLIGEKSFLFRDNIRLATSKHTKTRGFDRVSCLDRDLRILLRQYKQVRAAFISLDADQSVLDKYQTIDRVDLKAQSVVVEPNAGGRNTSQSWFWNLDIEHDASQSDYMAEHMSSFCVYY